MISIQIEIKTTGHGGFGPQFSHKTFAVTPLELSFLEEFERSLRHPNNATRKYVADVIAPIKRGFQEQRKQAARQKKLSAAKPPPSE
jgi:hypothetical protein